MPNKIKLFSILCLTFLYFYSCGDNITVCSNNPCTLENQSICIIEGDSYSCRCDPGYQLDSDGAFCIESKCNKDCTSKARTHCEKYASDEICVCDRGYTLIDNKCISEDPCSSNPCKDGNKTLCSKVDIKTYECYCKDGFRLKDDSCIKVSDYGDKYSILGNSTNLDLINKLYDLVKDHKSLSYNGAKNKIGGSNGIDVINGQIECAYSGIKHNRSRWDKDINCEHVWPQSYFGKRTPMKSDLHHLFAVTSNINSKRGNVHFGNVETICPNVTEKSCKNQQDCRSNIFECNRDNLCEKVHWAYDWDGIYEGKETGCKKGSSSKTCGSYSIFEVRDEIKGDVARAMFYFAIRYKNKSINQSQYGGTGRDNYIPYYEEKYLRLWHILDPVDDKEYERNNKIEKIQHNRNPFIDRPDLVGKISDF